MSLLEFLLTFVLLSLVGSATIYGWFLSTRGEWQVTPDGKWKKTGMIFKYWSLFWEQYRKTKVVIYAGEGLRQKFNLLAKVHPGISSRLALRGNDIKYISILNEKDLPLITDCFSCKVELLNDNLGMRLVASTEVPVYDWPEWIQKPFSSCATCMAGPYGTIIWLGFLKLQRGAFAWTDSPISAKIMLGFGFLLTLACLNTLLHKKLKF